MKVRIFMRLRILTCFEFPLRIWRGDPWEFESPRPHHADKKGLAALLHRAQRGVHWLWCDSVVTTLEFVQSPGLIDGRPQLHGHAQELLMLSRSNTARCDARRWPLLRVQERQPAPGCGRRYDADRDRSRWDGRSLPSPRQSHARRGVPRRGHPPLCAARLVSGDLTAAAGCGSVGSRPLALQARVQLATCRVAVSGVPSELGPALRR
jgi:hypothetical protein